MTKEELQKEAENYLNQNCKRWESDSLCVDDIAIENYLAGAEPREKRIAELERENVKLQGLVNQYKASKCSGISMFNRNMIMSDQLVKAKEIIKEFVEWANWQGNSKCPSFKSIQDKAEQFLNEVEK